MKLRLVLAVVFSTGLLACGSSRINTDPGTTAGKEGLAKVYVAWVKDKGSKWDMNLQLRNESDKPIIIFLNDIRCARGTVEGDLKHTFFNTGERTIQFRPGQFKQFNAVCKLPGATTGDYSITVTKVFDNPSNDGKTPGKQLGGDLVWKQSDRK